MNVPRLQHPCFLSITVEVIHLIPEKSAQGLILSQKTNRLPAKSKISTILPVRKNRFRSRSRIKTKDNMEMFHLKETLHNLIVHQNMQNNKRIASVKNFRQRYKTLT